MSHLASFASALKEPAFLNLLPPPGVSVQEGDVLDSDLLSSFDWNLVTTQHKVLLQHNIYKVHSYDTCARIVRLLSGKSWYLQTKCLVLKFSFPNSLPAI